MVGTYKRSCDEEAPFRHLLFHIHTWPDTRLLEKPKVAPDCDVYKRGILSISEFLGPLDYFSSGKWTWNSLGPLDHQNIPILGINKQQLQLTRPTGFGNSGFSRTPINNGITYHNKQQPPISRCSNNQTPIKALLVWTLKRHLTSVSRDPLLDTRQCDTRLL